MGVKSKFSMGNPYKYPDMGLYQEILFLKQFFKGKFCIENVIPYYKPLIPAFEVDNHLFWTNYAVGSFPKGSREHYGSMKDLQRVKGFNLDKYKGVDKRKILRNCVNPHLGLHVFKEAQRTGQQELFK